MQTLKTQPKISGDSQNLSKAKLPTAPVPKKPENNLEKGLSQILKSGYSRTDLDSGGKTANVAVRFRGTASNLNVVSKGDTVYVNLSPLNPKNTSPLVSLITDKKVKVTTGTHDGNDLSSEGARKLLGELLKAASKQVVSPPAMPGSASKQVPNTNGIKTEPTYILKNLLDRLPVAAAVIREVVRHKTPP